MLLKIGELARRTGLTVRTLHHYDAIGLLRPTGRSTAGYRLYDRHDVGRLHRIQALRRLDLSLAEIIALLEGGGPDLDVVIAEQMAALERDIARATALHERLAGLREQVRAAREPSMDDWLATLAMMHFHDRYFSEEELQRLQRGSTLGDRSIEVVRDQLRAMMEAGVAPDSEQVLPLAERWIALSKQYMAGDPRLMHKLHVLHWTDPTAGDATGVDPALLDYLTRATAEYRLSLYARHIDAAVMKTVRPRFLRHYLEWPPLFAEAHSLQERGAAAQAPETLDLARRWLALFVGTWGENPAVHEQVLRVNALEPALMEGVGIGADALALVRDSIACLMNKKP